MAFSSAAGYGNLPNGKFTPEIFSQKVLKFLRQKTIVTEVTNTDFAGEIAAYGDTVHIIKQPTVTVADYKRGTALASQDLIDDETTLVVNQAKYYQFALDDIEVRQGHVDYEALAKDAAGFALQTDFEQTIFADMWANVATANINGSAGAPTTCGFASGATTPYDLLLDLRTKLAQANVPMEDGQLFIIADPIFTKQLYRHDSKLLDVAVTGDPQSPARNARLLSSNLLGFRYYETNNAPKDGSGNYLLLAGHKSATATAQALTQSEIIRDPNTFAWKYRGLHVYGDKVIRTTGLSRAHYTVGT